MCAGPACRRCYVGKGATGWGMKRAPGLLAINILHKVRTHPGGWMDKWMDKGRSRELVGTMPFYQSRLT